MMNNKYSKKLALAAAIALCVCHVSNAATVTATMTNTVNISSSCTVATTGFTTTYDPLNLNASTNQDVTATVTTSCTLLLPAVITLGQGAHAASGSTDIAPLRRLANAGNTAFLNYALYQETGRSTTWGNTALTGVAVVGTGASASNTVYARIPSGQAPGAVGSFTDSVLVTVTY
ncbi:spore coat U domain-containing protein [Undibacterium sp.]|uniref:Csu type fimbrial protein n=1 Tax=Undibacterium sp. TaxID=1914977 RepID=UPI00374D30BF